MKASRAAARTANTLEELVDQVNAFEASVNDRLDRIEAAIAALSSKNTSAELQAIIASVLDTVLEQSSLAGDDSPSNQVFTAPKGRKNGTGNQ